MRDLNQIAKDAERVEASAKAWLSECDGLDRDEIEYHEAERRLAAFASDLLDGTPATPEWVGKVTPMYHDLPAFSLHAGSLYFSDHDGDARLSTPTRGCVRAFALAMGLTLTEEITAK